MGGLIRASARQLSVLARDAGRVAHDEHSIGENLDMSGTEATWQRGHIASVFRPVAPFIRAENRGTDVDEICVGRPSQRGSPPPARALGGPRLAIWAKTIPTGDRTLESPIATLFRGIGDLENRA